MTLQLEITDDLLKAAQEEAKRRGINVNQVIAQCLRESLPGRNQPSSTESIHRHIFRGDGLQPGVDLCNNRATRDLLDSDGPA